MRPISPSQSLPGRELWGNPAPYNLEALVDRDIARWCVRCNILAMARAVGNRPGLEEIRTRIQGLRNEIEELRKADQEKRLSRTRKLAPSPHTGRRGTGSFRG